MRLAFNPSGRAHPKRNLTALCVLLTLCGTSVSPAIILLESQDPGFHTATPGDNSGWQYEGKFLTFLGVPIAPHFFITAKHIGGTVGATFDFHGDLYTTIAKHPSPTTDLCIWEVDHAKPFPVHAPLSSGASDVGAIATVFGRGTQAGIPVTISSVLRGWKWGASDDVKRWGRNIVTGTLTDPTYGNLLYCDFDSPGISGECHMSVGDSGGGLFVLENGLWCLAGINLAVDGPFRTSPSDPSFYGAIFDLGGFEYNAPPWTLIPDQVQDIPSSFYCSRISSSLPWIISTAPGSNSIPQENYEAWQKLYFSPTQISNPALSGRSADFDGDGIPNLLEFALHLDPIFSENIAITPGTGVRGLPHGSVVDDNGTPRLALEFIRRSTTSGAGLTYVVEFSQDLTTWSSGGALSSQTINSRWERVIVLDPIPASSSSHRYARLRVISP